MLLFWVYSPILFWLLLKKKHIYQLCVRDGDLTSLDIGALNMYFFITGQMSDVNFYFDLAVILYLMYCMNNTFVRNKNFLKKKI